VKEMFVGHCGQWRMTWVDDDWRKHGSPFLPTQPTETGFCPSFDAICVRSAALDEHWRWKDATPGVSEPVKCSLR
jgi:hypothetical protein